MQWNFSYAMELSSKQWHFSYAKRVGADVLSALLVFVYLFVIDNFPPIYTL